MLNVSRLTHPTTWRAVMRLKMLILAAVTVFFTIPHGGQLGMGEQYSARPVVIGSTFSQKQAAYLGISSHDAFTASTELGFPLIRLGSYWSDVEPRRGEFDFAKLDWLIDEAGQRKVGVVLTVGMKAPRWPEYFLPSWIDASEYGYGATVAGPTIQSAVLEYIRVVVERYRDNPVVQYWQVENEPFDPAGSKQWRIDPGLLAEEISLVRSLDHHQRPVISTAYVQTNWLLDRRDQLLGNSRSGHDLLPLVDILGLDIYLTVGARIAGFPIYFHATDDVVQRKLADYQAEASSLGREIWITEAQAEPWEPGRIVDVRPENPPSQTPHAMLRTVEVLRAAGMQTILLWGVEHWYMRRTVHQDPTWWESAERVASTTHSRPSPIFLRNTDAPIIDPHSRPDRLIR
jgi:hypothetical protein